MVVVTIELWPGGGEEGKRTLGVLMITNDGTSKDPALGNYRYVLSHAGKYFGKKMKQEPFKQGRIKGFKRSLSPYRLVQRCLKDAGEV